MLCFKALVLSHYFYSYFSFQYNLTPIISLYLKTQYVSQLLHFKMISLFFLCLSFQVLCCSSQKICPKCGSMEVPYPLSTDPSCGDPNYSLRCDSKTKQLYFDTLNKSSYLVLQIMPTILRMVVRPSPWLPSTCVTQDMPISEGIWLNQTLPFSITFSNTVFLLNCSPRLLVSPLNCTPSSLCHRYLERAGHIDTSRAKQCSSELRPCCTFIAGGLPSAYKIRLHNSGCKAYRSILHLDPAKPASQWEEGLEIQWAPPREPICRTQLDCSGNSKCTKGISRCICVQGYYWDCVQGTCLKRKKASKSSPGIAALTISVPILSLVVVFMAITARKLRQRAQKSKLAKEREDILNSSSGGKSARMFRLKELRRATKGFSKDMILGSGGFGEVYKGELQDGTVVAVKTAKLGSLKSTRQVLNEVGILSQVNHKNLVKLLGCCVESEQPLMIYEYIPNGTLRDHFRPDRPCNFLDQRARLKIALQTSEALAYLHSSAHTPIYHRDVKSTNILLDEEFNAKVADFGLSRLARPGLSHVSTCAQGTLGYLDPEYYRNYQLTDKSDVYSFGVVLLELLTSQKAIDFERDEDDVNLAIYVGRHVSGGGDIMEVVDRRLLGSCASESLIAGLRRFSDVALSCLKETKNERPAMRDVARELERVVQVLDEGSDGDVGELIP